ERLRSILAFRGLGSTVCLSRVALEGRLSAPYDSVAPPTPAHPRTLRRGSAMSLTIGCPTCGKQFQMREHLRGMTVRCKACQQLFIVKAPISGKSEKMSGNLSDALAEPGYRLANPDPARPRPGRRDDDDYEYDEPLPRGAAIGLLLRGGGVGAGILVV